MKEFGQPKIEDADIPFQIKMIHDEISRQMTQHMKKLDVTPSQAAILRQFSLAGKRQLPLKLLEKQLHIAQSTVAGLVKRLEEKGMIQLVEDPQDRRSKQARITDKGLEVEGKAKQNMIETRDRLLSGMTETEQGILHSLLVQAYKSIYQAK
ncbi:MarR family winged helix-turn-helix transcriptional regulator [Lactobacillus sp.]|uniref:MarR family winged helix-turn-helix transcriptional regulator n=1 Tax=Lactobacillus sp. TaxID=1591 RepID=UPI003EFEC42F